MEVPKKGRIDYSVSKNIRYYRYYVARFIEAYKCMLPHISCDNAKQCLEQIPFVL